MLILRKIVRFFDRNFGWFFINGNKAENWEKYINHEKKIKEDTDSQ